MAKPVKNVFNIFPPWIRLKNGQFSVQNIEIQSIYDLEISTKNLEIWNPEKQPRYLEIRNLEISRANTS